jgi:hypothetical protein
MVIAQPIEALIRRKRSSIVGLSGGMASPYAAGDGGTHLEARVTASCLAAILCEASIRGLPGEYATKVRTQRAAFGDPLDDVIVDGTNSDGRATKLHLQVKNKLTFTANDHEWVEVLHRAWDTVSGPVSIRCFIVSALESAPTMPGPISTISPCLTGPNTAPMGQIF